MPELLVVQRQAPESMQGGAIKAADGQQCACVEQLGPGSNYKPPLSKSHRGVRPTLTFRCRRSCEDTWPLVFIERSWCVGTKVGSNCGGSNQEGRLGSYANSRPTAERWHDTRPLGACSQAPKQVMMSTGDRTCREALRSRQQPHQRAQACLLGDESCCPIIDAAGMR